MTPDAATLAKLGFVTSLSLEPHTLCATLAKRLLLKGVYSWGREHDTEVTLDDPDGEADGELLELGLVVGTDEFKNGFDWDGTGVICILEIDTELFCWDIVELFEIFEE